MYNPADPCISAVVTDGETRTIINGANCVECPSAPRGHWVLAWGLQRSTAEYLQSTGRLNGSAPEVR